MKLKFLFETIGIISLLLLVLQVILQVIQLRENRIHLSKWRIWVNWVLVLLLVIGFGGGALSKSRTIHLSQEDNSVKKSSSSSHVKAKKVGHKTATNAEIKFNPTAQLGKDNTVRVIFTIPPKTQMQLARDDNKQVLATANNPTGKEIQFSFLFGQDGTFDVLGMKGKAQVEKKLVVNKQGTPAANGGSQANQQGYVTNYRQPLKWARINNKPGTASPNQPATQANNIATNK